MRPVQHNRQSRDEVTPFWVPSCVGAECAGADAGNAEILDLFVIFGEELDTFLLDIGVVWLMFFDIRFSSDLSYFFPVFSVGFFNLCFSTTSVLRVEAIVGLGMCNSVIEFRRKREQLPTKVGRSVHNLYMVHLKKEKKSENFKYKV